MDTEPTATSTSGGLSSERVLNPESEANDFTLPRKPGINLVPEFSKNIPYAELGIRAILPDTE